MKKTLLLCGLFISLMLWGGFSFAQCSPNPTVTDPTGTGKMVPDTLWATELQNTSDTLSIICPTHAIVSGNTVTIDHIVLKSYVNKPNWAIVACNPGTCVYTAGHLQCALVSGIPPSGSAGIIYLQVLVDVYVLILGQPVLVESNYNSGDTLVLVVNHALGVKEYETNGFKVIQNQPNPFSDETRIGCTTKTEETISLKVVDMLGNTVYTEKMNTRAGENYFNFTGSNLSNGVYFYSIMSNQNKIVTLKMIKGK